MSAKLKIVIADDHPLFRLGLRQVIEEEGTYQVEAAADGLAALQLIERVKPDVCILDLSTPLVDGLGVVREMRRRHWPGRIIILTMNTEEELFHAALEQGVDGYVLKDSAVSEILECIRQVLAGHPYISPTFLTHTAPPDASRISRLAQAGNLDRLTSAERRILKLIAQEKTSREIGDELGISPRTVENHRANIER
jgi:DNA-binding NarL/FixJ family response regulator